MKNICFYTDQTISGMTGGIGRITSVMTDYFRHHFGWKVYSIFAFDAKPDCELTQIEKGVKLRLHDRLNISPKVRDNYNKAVDFIKENNIEVVIIQTSLDVASKLRKKLDKNHLNQVKIVSVLHFAPGTDEWPWTANGLKGFIALIRNKVIHYATKKAYVSAYNSSDKLLLLSPNYIKEYQQYSNIKETSKLLPLPNCLSFTESIEDDEILQKRPIALVVARMEESQKRISLILRIWKKIESLDNQWQLQLVGDGPSLNQYKKLAQELELKNVLFEGRQAPIPYYKKASVFLMTSLFEGFPMTLVEASQFGCVPIVYNSFSSLGDVVNDGKDGFIIPDGNEDLFLERVYCLMNNESLRHNMSLNAISNCQRFSQSIICERWKTLLESL